MKHYIIKVFINLMISKYKKYGYIIVTKNYLDHIKYIIHTRTREIIGRKCTKTLRTLISG